ncbi:MAG: deoxyribose-phosphate aldolase [Firmicutes bacterium]|jgi:deoxyribose-phosphate aldolase|nr:deoxyribose-phosphate aldolase [Bacillota bacterium]MCL5971225.1 deoxyribose-phosphate aldolase [Bacillota bacterium]
MTRSKIAQKIQQTLVRPDATRDEILQLCDDCVAYQFNGAMIAPIWLPLVVDRLKDSGITICTALGYPMGGMTSLAKAFEVRDVIARGAQQIDFMPAIGFLKSGQYQAFKQDIRAVVDAAEGIPIKVMLEFGMLTAKEKTQAAELAIEAGVTYLKNSSGWGQGGQATVDDIRLLSRIAQGRALVKASGGIRTWEQAQAFVEAGAALLGTSAGVRIVTDSAGKSEDQY